MRLSRTLAALLFTSLGASKSFSFFGGGQHTLDPTLPVPGESPLEYCDATYTDNILIIDHINLSPNPPVPGESLIVEAVGLLTKDVAEGAYINIVVKYGLITLLKTKADLCEQVQSVDLDCPIKKGKTTITKDVDLPAEIPPGKYTVTADAYTVDDVPITCLTALIEFTMS